MSDYPVLEINLKQFEHNARQFVERCHRAGISFCGVIKSFWGTPEIARAYQAAGCDILASSRLSQLRRVREAGIGGPFMLIRIPMPDELEEAAELADCVLMSEESVLRAFDRVCARKMLRRDVVIMADLGDLREGFWDKKELVSVCAKVEREMPALHLKGIGVNLGCYGAITPTKEKMEELIALARAVEAEIGRKLEVVSGGATSSYGLLLSEKMPEGITELRMGEGPMVGCPDEVLRGTTLKDDLIPGHYTLKSEVLECKVKPSYPQGEIGIDAFGRRPEYVDRGMRRRALLGIGRADAGDVTKLIPREEGVEVIGGSSDHLILDVTDYPGEVKPGDIFAFDIKYENQLYLLNSPDVRLEFTGR